MTTPLPPQVPPTDIYRQTIKSGDVIVYGVGRGAIDFGIVDDIIYKLENRRVYDRATQKYTLQDVWAYSIKVAKRKESYSVNKFVRLTGSGHIFVLDGPRADAVRKDIEDSWVDNEA